ncbi:MAG: hypothetical protein AAFZ07_22110 [Actinomycetota bacterium]
MTERRPVRVAPGFLERLDVLLPAERGSNGEPSRLDFLRFELPAIEERLALRFQDQREVVPGRPDYRMVIATGTLIPRIVVIAQLVSDGSVVLLSVELDRDADW